MSPMSEHYVVYFCIIVGIDTSRAVMYLWIYEPISEMNGVYIRVWETRV